MYDNTIRIMIVPVELVFLPLIHNDSFTTGMHDCAVIWLTQLMYDFPEVGHEDSACGKSAAQTRKYNLWNHSNSRIIEGVRV